MINLFGFIITVVYFKLSEKLKKLPLLNKLPAIVIAGVMLIATLLFFKVDYKIYNESASYLTLMLIPSTVALGYPIYKNIGMLKKNKRIIYSAFLFASLVAIVSTYIAAKLCHADANVIESMLPKSVTAPIALEISKGIGAVPELTICVVVLTGVFGGMFGHKILKLIKVKSDIAVGLSIGAASHLIGTAKCVEKGKEKQIVMASVALIIVGIITAIVIPLFIYVLHH